MKRKAGEPLASCIQCRHGMGARLKGSSHWPFAYCHPSVRSQGIDEAREKWGLLDNDPCFRLLEQPNHFQKPLFWSWIWLSCDHASRPLNVFACCIPLNRLAKSFNTSWNVTNFGYQLNHWRSGLRFMGLIFFGFCWFGSWNPSGKPTGFGKHKDGKMVGICPFVCCYWCLKRHVN